MSKNYAEYLVEACEKLKKSVNSVEYDNLMENGLRNYFVQSGLTDPRTTVKVSGMFSNVDAASELKKAFKEMLDDTEPGFGKWMINKPMAEEPAALNVYEHVQSYAEKNCVNISVKPKSCHCCVDIEFNDTTATFNTNNGKEELQTLLYDLVAGK
jgi:hypothetical protein